MAYKGMRVSFRPSPAASGLLTPPRPDGRVPSIFQHQFTAPPRINYAALTPEVILSNQYIRLNTIYFIVDEDGTKLPFRMRPEQYDFYKNMHNRNIILKSRQIGFTTVIQLYLLDCAIFNENTTCGVIAHTKQDAEKFFDKKIKFAYDNIPADFKDIYVPAASQDSAQQLKFSNGSYISVGTSLRSDTVQKLHISEYGKLCAKFPDKAAEVKTGALNTVSTNNWITIESTGEGSHGDFYDKAMSSKRAADRRDPLTPLSYKFFFYPFWQSRKYMLNVKVPIEKEDDDYFRELEESSDIILLPSQKYWYVVKKQEQGEHMTREFPATAEEAFRGIQLGAPFSRVMALLRRRGHICSVPWDARFPVNTFWDLGRNDMMAIWFHQRIGFEDRFIDYYEDNFHPMHHYAEVLLNKPYTYGEHYLPHDAEVTDLTQTDSLTREEVLNSLGIEPTIIVPRISSEEEGVNMTRDVMMTCFFDEDKCAQGVTCLENVKYRWDDHLQAYQPNLQRTWAKHGADSFMQFGHGYRHRRPAMLEDKPRQDILARENRVGRQGRFRAAEREERRDWRI